MNKKLLLIPVISLGLFGGLTGGVSAAETENLEQVQVQDLSTINTYSSDIHDKAYELKNGIQIGSSTDRYNPIKYYKFYFDGSNAAFVYFNDLGMHKMTILNGNFIKVGDYYNDIVYSRDLTQGWNYVEVVDTMPSLSSSRYEIRASWN